MAPLPLYPINSTTDVQISMRSMVEIGKAGSALLPVTPIFLFFQVKVGTNTDIKMAGITLMCFRTRAKVNWVT